MSKDRDGRASQAQMKRLLDLLSTDGTLLDGKVDYTDTNKLKFWKRMAIQLNSVENGAIKNFHKWCKVWADWKAKTKKKADNLRKSGNPKPKFTKLELRLLKLINYPIHDDMTLSDCNDENKEEKFQACNETCKETDKLTINKDFDPIDESNDSSDGFNENNKVFISLGVQDKKDSSYGSDIFDNDKMLSEGININVEEKESKKFEDYKAKARLILEKERIHQKTEELKLKALELKLKADELKLQEAEVSRVNYLTQLEEQKLKCMTEIAASLKELVEWTKNGSTRFHNVM